MCSRDSNVNLLHQSPCFLITIDVEGDNLWSKQRTITTRNAKFLPRFQSLCESYGFKPTYLVDFEMANCTVFQEFGRKVLAEGTGEIGMHLHAWDTPPLIPLTMDDLYFKPYLIEYPENLIQEKVAFMTKLLKDIFKTNIISHRAGRWAFNNIYAKILVKEGYCVDCSVTPYISWKWFLGDPKQNGGTDYSKFPHNAYFIDPEDISKSGNSTLLEIPVTIIPSNKPLANFFTRSLYPIESLTFVRRILNIFFPPIMLRPNGKNLNDLFWIVKKAIHKERDYIQFMLHSSELMPQGSPIFPTKKHIEKLYRDIKKLFEVISHTFKGVTLEEYYNRFSRARTLSDRARA